MKKIKLILLFTISIGIQSIAFAQLTLKQYALENVNIVDVNNSTVLNDYTIVIRNNKILHIAPSAEYVKNDTIQTFSYKGKFVIPGLIDAHVHFATDATAEPRGNAEVVLKKMLLSGITSVRDMAGDARALASLSRDALVGDIDAPNIYYSSLMAGSEFFADPRTIATARGGISGEMSYMKAITDSTNIQLAVAEAKGAGSKGIKLYAKLTKDQMRKITAEGKKQNMPVWSHVALLPTTPSQVIESGVIAISHSSMLVYERHLGNSLIPKTWLDTTMFENHVTFWDNEYEKLNLSELYENMKNENVVLDATMSLKAGHYNNPKRHWRYEMSKRITRDANKAGVKIAAGSDSDQETFVQYEMKLLVNDCDFSPIEALIAATKNAAQATGILDFEGTIEKGKIANFVVLNKNPMELIGNIDSVHLVIKNGKIYSVK